MGIKEKITETAEKMYDLTREGKYDVKVKLLRKKTQGAKHSAIQVVSARDTAHTKKWRAKNH
ncbi:hypothetical protein GIX45_27175 [Erwinia sp. CPCC 100877]|nr:hypothetical protein [Erwinia sp. CPCC 100877]